MRTRTGVFYLSFAPGLDRQPVTLLGGGVAYIRVHETVRSEEEALDCAVPDSDERVMNTHKLSPQKSGRR